MREMGLKIVMRQNMEKLIQLVILMLVVIPGQVVLVSTLHYITVHYTTLQHIKC